MVFAVISFIYILLFAQAFCDKAIAHEEDQFEIWDKIFSKLMWKEPREMDFDHLQTIVVRLRDLQR